MTVLASSAVNLDPDRRSESRRLSLRFECILTSLLSCITVLPTKAILALSGPVYLRENGVLRLTSRVTIANNTLPEIPHINTPMMLSSGPNVRQFDGRLTSPQPTVA